jgi:hypothetical protein
VLVSGSEGARYSTWLPVRYFSSLGFMCVSAPRFLCASTVLASAPVCGVPLHHGVHPQWTVSWWSVC